MAFLNRCAGVAVVNDGVRKIENLLELICRLSSSNVDAVGKLRVRSSSLSPTSDIGDPLAKQELKYVLNLKQITYVILQVILYVYYYT